MPGLMHDIVSCRWDVVEVVVRVVGVVGLGVVVGGGA